MHGATTGMEIISDKAGAAWFACAGPGVYLARFSGHLSTQLASGHLSSMEAAMVGTKSFRYFLDASTLTGFDIEARSKFIRTLRANRAKLGEIVVLGGSGERAARAGPLIESLGQPLVVTHQVSDFQRRLIAASPGAGRLLTRASKEGPDSDA